MAQVVQPNATEATTLGVSQMRIVGTPELLKEIRATAGDAGRMAKLVQDAGLDERRQVLVEKEQLHFAAVLGLVLGAYGLDGDASDVRNAVVEAVRRVQVGDLSPLPSRLVQQITTGDERARAWDEGGARAGNTARTCTSERGRLRLNERRCSGSRKHMPS